MELAFLIKAAALHREPLQLGPGPSLEPFHRPTRLEPVPQRQHPKASNGRGPERLPTMRPKTKADCIATLISAGISEVDARALRRISMTLHHWHELECGNERGEAIERDEQTKVPYLTFDTGSNGKRGRTRIPDRETAALKRLAKIMKAYPGFASYVQGDPRGSALFILRPGDVSAGTDLDSCYSRGIAVFK